MCLLVFAWRTHPRYRLVVAANRDEFHDRPAAALGWWNDDGGVLGGRDLQAGGTWIGVARNGRFGAVTNFRELESPPTTQAPSRGGLVPGFLSGNETPGEYLGRLNGSASAFAGFNLLTGDSRELHYLSNRDPDGPRSLAPGIYGLGNHRLDTPWPKLVSTRERFAGLLVAPDPSPDELFGLMGDREPVPGRAQPGSGLPPDWERALSAPFVLNERYGTRCTTVVLAEHSGRTTVLERRFDASGVQSGATRLEFTDDTTE